MTKLKVLMIGPGEPNALNSGLGVAAHHIAKYLANETELTIIQPDEKIGQEHSKTDFSLKVKNLNANKLNETNLISDLTKINVRAKISPYFYPYIELADDDNSVPELSDSDVKTALAEFTQLVVNESKAIDFDVIYAHDWTALPAGMEIKEKTNKPLITHIHSLDYDRNSKLNHSWVYELEKKSFQLSDAIISVSQYTNDVIAHNYGEIDESKIHTVYNGNEPIAHRKTKKVFKEKLVLFVGRLTGQKGPNIFMEIAEKLLQKHKNTRFVLAGNGHLMTNLINAAASKKLGSRFHFTGHIDQDQLLDLYAMCDVYCMPSVSEPFGLTAIEAANAGLPMVLSRQSGASEVLSGALYADHWDVDGFVSHILTVFKNDKKRKKMIEQNKTDLKTLTWENTADQVLKVFNTFR
ncbi:glycosyltransferase [Reichenbachiella sp. MALMAid0571]|uniref:glycosyltransferase n=1 Tax=Reichenbachiella sp. MALMAid0571 TaxID=3143939 RepID=UPI0032DFB69E